MFEFGDTPLEGLKTVRPTLRPDERGWFLKLFHAPSFRDAGLVADFQEQYCSSSRRGVLRGMHFQTPPHGHAKLVYCLEGRVLDVALDLREASSTYGKSFGVELDGARRDGVYLPRGFAHGFLTLSETALLSYHVETAYAPEYDAGIRWDGFGFAWPAGDPSLSPRDGSFPRLAEFHTPFRS